ncbi:MAG: T9SS type A sorting domain-containing protein [Bacteroidales bacterium]|nr:T9SS type A sorting domain-containing protein [Bacteroidales bacterium]
MKKTLLHLLFWCLLLTTPLAAQNPDSTIAIPNGSFENWSTGNGYSVTVLFFPLTVYSSYTYPTGWSYPTYPVNESITYSGMNVNVNTNLPLLKVSNETSGVVDGSHALKMQSFMLSDIISSTVYSLAESSLDPMYTSTIFPTVLSTGVVDIDNLMPMMSTIVSNLGSPSQLMAAFANEDLNSFITGGLPLNGAVPDRLTGYYKYTSAVSGDNGGILILGSKYNTTTHKREVVGAGYTTALTDISTYTPFELSYTSLSEIDSSYPYVEADSLVILLFSSANTSPQQGSALYLDHLQLWSVLDTDTVVTDTCSAVFNLHIINVDSTSVTIGWGFEGDPHHFEAEYGVQGFSPGSGTVVGLTESFLHLSNLQPDTYYDVYVHCVCDSNTQGDWAMITFHTDTLVPPVIDDPTGVQTFIWQNVERQYLVRTPIEHNGTLPVVFFLHGLGDEIVSCDNQFHFSQIANDYGWVIVVPQALDLGIGSMWNAELFSSDVDDSGFLMALLDTLMVHYPIDPDSVFFTGFSMGGFMTHRMAIEHGDRITACAPVSGLITTPLSALTPVAPVKMLHIHGTSDNVVGYNGYSSTFGMTLGLSVENILQYWQNANNCSGGPTIDTLPDLHNDGLRFVRFTYSGSAELQHLKVIGGTHNWYQNASQYDVSYMDYIHDFFVGQESGDPVEDHVIQTFQIWPNPSTGIINIVTETVSTIEVLDMAGRVVSTLQLEPGANTLHFQHLSPGVYLLTSDGKQLAKLLIQ